MTWLLVFEHFNYELIFKKPFNNTAERVFLRQLYWTEKFARENLITIQNMQLPMLFKVQLIFGPQQKSMMEFFCENS